MRITDAAIQVEARLPVTLADLEERAFAHDVKIYLYSAFQARMREELGYSRIERLRDSTVPRRAVPLPDVKTPKGRTYTEVISRAAGELLRPNGQVDDYYIVEIVVTPAARPIPVVDPFDL